MITDMVKTILLAEDDVALRRVLGIALGRAGYNILPTARLNDLMMRLRAGEGDLLICDIFMPDGDARDILQDIQDIRPDCL
ncbi:MAG: response regulator [Pseudomonadota bacterium]